MIFPPKTILMPFAFNDESFAAWSFARLLADRFGARLIAFHVYEWSAPAGEVPPLPLSPEQRMAVKEKLAGAVGPDVILRFAEGGVGNSILKAAREAGADLLVMATAGRTGLKRLARDSVTEDVVRQSPIPVLSTHGYAPLPASILAPVNMQPYSLAGLEAAKKWARALEAPLTVLHVREKGDPRSGVTTRAALRRKISSAGARLRLAQGQPVEQLLKEAPAHGLVVMVAHRKGLLRDAILGTTAEQILRRSPVPVLTIPGPVSGGVKRLLRRASARRRLSRRRATSLRRTII